MPDFKICGNFSNSTYIDSGNGIETINTFGVSTRFNNTNFSVAIGNDLKFKGGKRQADNPFFEAKVKQNFNSNFNAQLRFRESGGTEQYRAAFGASYAFDKQNSIYGAIHATAKDKNGNWSYNTGAWIGYTHKFPNGISASAEIQQNIALNGQHTDIRSFNDGNKMVNFFLTIPF